MKIANYLEEDAEKYLRYHGATGFPVQLAGTAFFLTNKDDESIIAHGVVVHDSVEYKIGPKK